MRPKSGEVREPPGKGQKEDAWSLREEMKEERSGLGQST
jgi:hypothetical protein